MLDLLDEYVETILYHIDLIIPFFFTILTRLDHFGQDINHSGQSWTIFNNFETFW